MRLVRLYFQEVAAAIRCAFADRANFAIQVGGMLLNNGVFLALWWMFFAGFRSVGGWGLADMALMLGLMMTLFGLCGVLLGGYRDLAATILRGEIDAILTQPTGVLPRLLARESSATAWGDIVGGLVVLTLFAHLGWRDLPAVVLALLCGMTVFVSAGIAFASLAFWAAGARSFARDLTDFTLLFSSYPGSIYRGAVKVVAFTVLPAGFVVMLPVKLVRAPGWESAGLVVLGAALYMALACGLFDLGLRRYRRGASPAG